MPISQEQLTSIKSSLDILDGLTKAFKHLDEMFDELVNDAGADNLKLEDSRRYVQHCELLENLHSLTVTNLEEHRDSLMCQCAIAEA